MNQNKGYLLARSPLGDYELWLLERDYEPPELISEDGPKLVAYFPTKPTQREIDLGLISYHIKVGEITVLKHEIVGPEDFYATLKDQSGLGEFRRQLESLLTSTRLYVR